MFLHVTDAKYIDGYRVRVWFNDGTDAEIDLSHSIHGLVCDPLHDVQYFKSFSITGHTLAWPNGADFAPEYLRSLVQATSHA